MCPSKLHHTFTPQCTVNTVMIHDSYDKIPVNNTRFLTYCTKRSSHYQIGRERCLADRTNLFHRSLIGRRKIFYQHSFKKARWKLGKPYGHRVKQPHGGDEANKTPFETKAKDSKEISRSSPRTNFSRTSPLESSCLRTEMVDVKAND